MRSWLTVLLMVVGASALGEKPHIVHIVLDDWGWADVAWHRPAGYKDLQSPNMQALANEGVELDRHYVYKSCSPTRSALQSGRNPIHVNTVNVEMQNYNPKDKVSGYAGIPRNMTGMAEHMLRAGYETHMYGKWDAGMATPEHTPLGRGYQKSLNYFQHANDYWDMSHGKCGKSKITDLWDTDGPATKLTNKPGCSQSHQEGCKYEDQLFFEQVISAIDGRDKSKPLFIFWAPHSVHTPLQVPEEALTQFSFIKEKPRQYYHSMVKFIDTAIGKVVAKLKDEQMWDETLIILHSDNGGPIYHSGTAGANNYPLKGGKLTNWEGGIRANAIASGGFLPKAVRGTKTEGLMAGWDWYATFAALAGEDPTDHKAAAARLPPIDSFNLWPLLSGQNKTSPRSELAIGEAVGNMSLGFGPTLVGGLIRGQYKVLLGQIDQAGWPGPVYPTTPRKDIDGTVHCGDTVEEGCMYNIMEDPGEHKNIAASYPEQFKSMMARIAQIKKTTFSPNRGKQTDLACHYAEKRGGFWGPFIDV